MSQQYARVQSPRGHIVINPHLTLCRILPLSILLFVVVILAGPYASYGGLCFPVRPGQTLDRKVTLEGEKDEGFQQQSVRYLVLTLSVTTGPYLSFLSPLCHHTSAVTFDSVQRTLVVSTPSGTRKWKGVLEFRMGGRGKEGYVKWGGWGWRRFIFGFWSGGEGKIRW